MTRLRLVPPLAVDELAAAQARHPSALPASTPPAPAVLQVATRPLPARLNPRARLTPHPATVTRLRTVLLPRVGWALTGLALAAAYLWVSHQDYLTAAGAR